MDETAPQTTANTAKVWSYTKPTISKNTSKIRANTIGFYPIKGNRVIAFLEDSKTDSMKGFLKQIKRENADFKKIVIVLDNFSTHKAKALKEYAKKIGICLVYLPPYSPDLNPIEFTWKSLKRKLSTTFVKTTEEMKKIIRESWMELSKSITFAKSWMEKFIKPIAYYNILGK